MYCIYNIQLLVIIVIIIIITNYVSEVVIYYAHKLDVQRINIKWRAWL